LVILPFFVLPPRTRDDDSAPLVFDVTDDVSDDDKLPELSDSLPFSAGSYPPPCLNTITTVRQVPGKFAAVSCLAVRENSMQVYKFCKTKAATKLNLQLRTQFKITYITIVSGKSCKEYSLCDGFFIG